MRSVWLGAVGVARVIPSLAILFLAIPVLGIGYVPAVTALVLLALPPIAINTDLGLRSTDAAALDAGRGLGMDDRTLRRRVVWPLAIPAVFAGVRTAGVEVVASATLAAFVGAGGFGEYIVNGLASNDSHALLEGAAAVGALALAVDATLGFAERRAGERFGLERDE